VKEGGETSFLPEYRPENVYRTNETGANGRGRYLEQLESEKVFPYLVCDAVDDSRTRRARAALDGLVVKFGSPEADRIYPPNGYQCRCQMRGLTKRQAEALGIPSDAEVRRLIGENPPDEGWDGPPFVAGTGWRLFRGCRRTRRRSRGSRSSRTGSTLRVWTT
jgi:hypothetical protein